MKKRKETIGQNPLDAVIPEKTSSKNAVIQPNEGRDRLTLILPQNLVERLRNAVFWTPGLTLAQVGEESLSQAAACLEKSRGGPFPRRTAPVKMGRPVKV